MKRFKDNNKGFTLVELIVVIAVLAVITVVAAPQYLKYVEKSRVGTDENAIGEYAHIAEIEYVGLKAAADASDDVDDDVTVTIEDDGTVTFGTDELDKAVAEIAGDYTFKSETYVGQSVTITITNGVADWDPITASSTPESSTPAESTPTT